MGTQLIKAVALYCSSIGIAALLSVASGEALGADLCLKGGNLVNSVSSTPGLSDYLKSQGWTCFSTADANVQAKGNGAVACTCVGMQASDPKKPPACGNGGAGTGQTGIIHYGLSSTASYILMQGTQQVNTGWVCGTKSEASQFVTTDKAYMASHQAPSAQQVQPAPASTAEFRTNKFWMAVNGDPQSGGWSPPKGNCLVHGVGNTVKFAPCTKDSDVWHSSTAALAPSDPKNRIRNASTGQCLVAVGNGPPQLAPCDANAPRQFWAFNRTGNGTYYLQATDGNNIYSDGKANPSLGVTSSPPGSNGMWSILSAYGK